MAAPFPHLAPLRDPGWRGTGATRERSAQVVSCPRQHQGRSALVVAPRLVSKMMGPEAATLPVGRDAWGETLLVLPDSARAARWRNILTDETFADVTTPGRWALEQARVFLAVPLRVAGRGLS
jgi:maltooligosyltrehalose synthase